MNLRATITLSSEELGFWPDCGPGANIWKFRDRVFIGDAADNSGNYYPPRGSWLPDDVAGAGWAIRDAQLAVMATDGNMAVVGASRTSDNPGTNGEGDISGHVAIGLSGFLINDKPQGRGWAGYFDVQHEAGATWSTGAEIAVKNKGANVTHTPYSIPGGATGVWMQGGGDPRSGGPAVNPAASVVTVVRNPFTPVGTFNAFAVIAADALTGAFGTVLAMAKGHQLVWYTPGNGIGASIRSDVSEPGHRITMGFVNDGVNFYGDNGQIAFAIRHVPNGVNQIIFTDAAAGQAPVLGATGPDANIDLALVPKGTGMVRLGEYEAATNSIIVKDSAGTIRRLQCV
jgi:hypothetical protein